MIQIPDTELEFSFSRSSGVGGQNVNKVNTKATLRWNLAKSKILDIQQKQILAKKIKNKLNAHGNLILYSQEHRTQHQNKTAVTEKLNQIINQALKTLKKRVATEPTKNSQNKRFKEKKIISEKKKLRKIASLDPADF